MGAARLFKKDMQKYLKIACTKFRETGQVRAGGKQEANRAAFKGNTNLSSLK